VLPPKEANLFKLIVVCGLEKFSIFDCRCFDLYLHIYIFCLRRVCCGKGFRYEGDSGHFLLTSGSVAHRMGFQADKFF